MNTKKIFSGLFIICFIIGLSNIGSALISFTFENDFQYGDAFYSEGSCPRNPPANGTGVISAEMHETSSSAGGYHNLTISGYLQKCSGNQYAWDLLSLCWNNVSCPYNLSQSSVLGTNGYRMGGINAVLTKTDSNTYYFSIDTPYEVDFLGYANDTGVIKFSSWFSSGDHVTNDCDNYQLSNYSGIYNYNCTLTTTTTISTTTTLKQCWFGCGNETEEEVYYINATVKDVTTNTYLNHATVDLITCYDIPASYGYSPHDNSLPNMKAFYLSNGYCEIIANQTTDINGRTVFRIKKNQICELNKEFLILGKASGYSYDYSFGSPLYENECNYPLLYQYSWYNPPMILYRILGVKPVTYVNTDIQIIDKLTGKNISDVYLNIIGNSGITIIDGYTDIYGNLNANLTADTYKGLAIQNNYTTRNDLEFTIDGTSFYDYELFYLVPLNASMYSISGYVYDGTKNPIRYCKVSAKCGAIAKMVFTDSNGSYYIDNAVLDTDDCIISSLCEKYVNDYPLYLNYITTDLINQNISLTTTFTTGYFYGTITDFINPSLELANVKITAQNLNNPAQYSVTYSDWGGYYETSELESGNYSLTYQLEGYEIKIDNAFLSINNKHDVKLSNIDKKYYMRGSCILNSVNPIQCKIKVYNGNLLLKSFNSNSNGQFQYLLIAGNYNIEATYNNSVQTTGITLIDDMNYNDLIFDFKSTTQTLIFAWENFYNSMVEGITLALFILSAFAVIIGVLIALIILSALFFILEQLSPKS